MKGWEPRKESFWSRPLGSSENDVFDSSQVLSQHESEILNDLDQRLSFLSAQHFDQRSASQNFQIKKVILKESLWDQGSGLQFARANYFLTLQATLKTNM